jgi:hypothetical protein
VREAEIRDCELRVDDEMMMIFGCNIGSDGLDQCGVGECYIVDISYPAVGVDIL